MNQTKNDGEKMERQMWEDIEAKNWKAVEGKIAEGFQSVHPDGARDRAGEISLIKNLNVGKTALSDFKSTTNGDSIVVIYMISAQETIDLERIAREPARNPGPSVNALPESEVRLRRVGVETQGNFRFGTRFFCE